MPKHSANSVNSANSVPDSNEGTTYKWCPFGIPLPTLVPIPQRAQCRAIPCRDQEEIDYYWHSLISGGGSEGNCGWCKDKFGFSWQVVPAMLGEWMSDPERAPRVVQAFLGMKKMDMGMLRNA